MDVKDLKGLFAEAKKRMDAQIDHVKKQYGIYAQPMPNAPMGQQMEHTATVLLFDDNGSFVTTIASDEPDSDALAKLKKLVA